MNLAVEHASFAYRHSQPIVERLSFSLGPGEILAVLGPNGVGKTTLLNAMTGMVKWQEGRTLVHHRPLADYGPRELWRVMGYVPQARTNAFSYSVLDMVLLGRSAHLGLLSQPGQDDVTEAQRVLDRLEIGHLRDAFCDEVSGGELQLVFLARALTGSPSILLLDEPESHLDFKKQLIILDIIERLARDDDIICVLNTHFPNNALRVADKVLMLSDDRTYHFGETKDVLSAENLRTCFGVNAAITEFQAEGTTHCAIYPISLAEKSTPERIPT